MESKNKQSKKAMLANSGKMYVVHTVGQNEYRLRKFNSYLAKGLGQTASMKTVESMHLTIMSMPKIGDILQGREPAEYSSIGRLATTLQEELVSSTGRRKISVLVDRRRPLATMGRNNNILCLMLIHDPLLTEQRRITEEYFSRILGSDMPPTHSFQPHIALGIVHEPLFPKLLRKKPEEIVPDPGMIPRAISLNGVACFVGRIHEQEHIL